MPFVATGIVLGWAHLSEPPRLLDGVEFSRVILDRDGHLMRLGLTADQKYRERVHLEDIPPEAIESVLRYEDRYFWNHPGINPLSMVRAALTRVAGGRVMGGSTITMQTARLTAGLKTGSLSDKIRQILLALRLEAHYSKAEILTAYFNLAPYGGNIEGIGAAARVYFHKPASRLTPSESVALMLVPQNPAARRPSQNNPRFIEAHRRLLSEWFGQTEFAPLRVYRTADLPFRAPHLCAELLQRKDLPDLVRTSIDPAMQQITEEEIRRYIDRTGAFGIRNASAMIVHWPSLQVRSLVGSASFSDESIGGQIDGTAIRRSPGSTLKPFIYAKALEEGLIHPKTILSDVPKSFAGYDPQNFDGEFKGPIAADLALRLSRNIPAISLAARLKKPGLYGFLREGGVQFQKSESHYGLSLVLGGAEVTMRELASLYAMLANRGELNPLQWILADKLTDPPVPKKLLTPEAAFTTLHMLTAEDPAFKARSNRRTISLYPKTGTSNGYRDAWTAGVFGPYVLVVWAGNFDNASNPMLVGAQTALPLFQSIARRVALNFELTDPLSNPKDLNVERIDVCRATGDIDTTLCPGNTASTWFIPGVSPVRNTGILQRILIDSRTGLRDCVRRDDDTREVVWEFWPTELQRQFLRAGITKPEPPAWRPECRRPSEVIPQGKPPQIIHPKPGLEYAGADSVRIPLTAHADSGTSEIFWLLGNRLLAVTRPGETAFVTLPEGEHPIHAVDSAGRSASRTVHVRKLQ